MDPMMASAFMGGAGGGGGDSGDSSQATADSGATAGSGSMSFSSGKALPIIIGGAIALAGLVLIINLSGK